MANIKLVVPLDGQEVGDIIRVNRQEYVIKSIGKWFEIDEDMPSFMGSHLLGFEGEHAAEMELERVENHDQGHALAELV